MRWVTALKLEDWARTVGSRTELGAVLSDLCRASGPDIAAVRFPSGDKGQVRGFDGHVVSHASAMNVPEGRSLWEFGVDENYRAKLLSDFQSRSTDVDSAAQAETTLVLVTPWTWDSSDKRGKIEDWLEARRGEASWKAVRVLDGVALEAWLDARPGVAAWHGRNTFRSLSPQGVHSTDEFWAEIAGRFGPPLTEEVLLCERSGPAQQVIGALMGPSGALQVLADSADEAIAFAVAAIRRAEPEQRLFLEARTLVVDDAQAARPLLTNDNLVLLLRNEAARSPRQFAERFSVLVPLSRQQRGQAALALGRPSGFAFGQALQTMGIPENEALTLARGCGRSLTALERLQPGGRSEAPRWMSDAAELLPLLLAGAWDATNGLDTALVSEIAGKQDYLGLETTPRTHLAHEDPPFDLEGPIWKVRAPLDAFVRIGHLLDGQQAARLRAAMIKVFSRVEKSDDVDGLISFPRERVEHYSGWLREGLATTLLLLAVWSKIANVNFAARSGQSFADDVFSSIPNLGEDHRLWESLRTELPLLAEAAPTPFLAALERLLKGEAIKPLLEEKEGLLFPVSRLPPLLWALETVAWDPVRFRAAVLLLAELAAVAKPGRTGNSARNSLHEIFILWNPNTNADLDQRLAVLDEIVARHPEVGWELLIGLLPQLHGFSSPTAKPKLREGGAVDRAPVTMSEYRRGQAGAVARVVGQAGDDAARWIIIVKAMANFAPDERLTALKTLDKVLAKLGEARLQLWRTLRDEVAKHEGFRGAQWALPEAELIPWRDLVKRHEPEDIIDNSVWLFDSWTFDNLRDEKDADSRRSAVLRDIVARSGTEGLVRLASKSRLPHLVVRAFNELEFDADFIKSAFLASREADPTGVFTISLASLYKRSAGDCAAFELMHHLLTSQAATADEVAAYLSGWPDTTTTWNAARRLNSDVANAYWHRHGMFYDKGMPRRDVLRALTQLRRANRPVAALGSATQRLTDIPTRLLLKLLAEVVNEVNAGPDTVDTTMLSHYVELAFAELDRREDVSDLDIAVRELALHPLLRFTRRRLQLHSVMARDPSVFMGFLGTLYRSDQDPQTEPDEETKARANRAYQILAEFHRLPGTTEEGIEADALTEWIDAVRTWASANGRADAAEGAIGKLLAHAPPDPDGGWPARAVRDQIERLSSEVLENSIGVERFNMRGVHSRAVYAGGDDERVLAESYKSDAAHASAWPRTASMLLAIAADWDEHALAQDAHAAQMKLRS